jgi:hypothetical protein
MAYWLTSQNKSDWLTSQNKSEFLEYSRLANNWYEPGLDLITCRPHSRLVKRSRSQLFFDNPACFILFLDNNPINTVFRFCLDFSGGIVEFQKQKALFNLFNDDVCCPRHPFGGYHPGNHLPIFWQKGRVGIL